MGARPLEDALGGVKAAFLLIAFSSDWLYPAPQNKEIADALRAHNLEVSYCVLDSPFGHDAFLIDPKHQTHLITHFLRHIHEEHAHGRHGR